LPLAINNDERKNLHADAERLQIEVERRRLKKSMHAFVTRAWSTIEPAQEFKDNWHIREICKILEDIADGRTKRVIINVPPGTMKSLLVSVFWQAWMWARNPKLRVATASYAASITIDQNRKVRELVNSAWYQELFPLAFTEDQDTKIRFNTTEGGWRIATSVGGALTGEHPDIIIIDDAITAEQAKSDQERKAANGWFDSTVSTRGVARNVAVVVIGQRLHEEDLPGYLLKRGGWLHVCFPMRFEKCTCVGDEKCALHKTNAAWHPDPRDPRTETGQLLWPELFNEEKVKQLERDLGPYDAAGQLQQRPSPGGGGLFKAEWFKFCNSDELPKRTRKARGWDTAGTEGDGDWTRGVKISEEVALRPAKDSEGRELGYDSWQPTGRFFIEDVKGGQLGPDGVDKLMLLTAEQDGKECAIREEKEGGASGLAVVKARARMFRGWDYAGVQVSGSKVVRAKPFRAQCEAGNVTIVRSHWNDEYIKELCAFPTAAHDDQVDASSCAFNAVLLEPVRDVVVHEAVWG
jgi:predicted phage terminase large subunit-like protein